MFWYVLIKLFLNFWLFVLNHCLFLQEHNSTKSPEFICQCPKFEICHVILLLSNKYCETYVHIKVQYKIHFIDQDFSKVQSKVTCQKNETVQGLGAFMCFWMSVVHFQLGFFEKFWTFALLSPTSLIFNFYNW